MRPRRQLTNLRMFSLIGLFFWSAVGVAAADDPLAKCADHVRVGAPQYVKGGEDVVALCRLGYALSYNNARKVPDWVAWHLPRAKAMGCLPRKDAFASDKDIPKGKRAEVADYRNSGYDRGHLAPNADFLWNLQAQRQSFLLSNMAPQLHQFNDGIWGDLEDLTRVWATDRGEVYVIAGPLFEGRDRWPIGKNRVGVPSHFYKVIYDPNTREALAFIFVHGQIRKSAFGHFQFTVRDVERRTGLNFLSRLPKQVEDRVETTKPDIWDADLAAWIAAKKKKCASER